MKKLFLDDIRIPADCLQYTHHLIYSEEWVIVRTYDQFVSYILENGIPEIISFDHDLHEEHYRDSMYDTDGHYSNYYTDGTFTEKTGYDCAKWLLNYCLDNKKEIPQYVYIHSMNPVGAQNIKSLFDTYNKIHK